MKRPAFAPEVTSAHHDLESSGTKVYGSHMVGLDGAPKIQPFQALGGDASKNRKGSRGSNADGAQRVGMLIGGIWLFGVVVLGYEVWWPLRIAFEMLYAMLSTPPFSWFFGWILSPMQWITGWAYKGTPMVEQVAPLQELRLPVDQVPLTLNNYVSDYGDAALLFASHDGYPQLVSSLLGNKELGYRDLLDATDDNGNTALIYSSAKGYRQTTALLLRNGADPDIPNRLNGGGRTGLMEAAGLGYREIVVTLAQANATIDLTDDFGNTALHYAAYHGHLPVVQELLKWNPTREIQNSYGHTAASYAATNKHKGVADLLSRLPTKREQERAQKLAEQTQKPADGAGGIMKGLAEDFGLDTLFGGNGQRPPKLEKHVKGSAEDLHKTDRADFAPKLAKAASASTGTGEISDTERKALEDQLASLRHQHDEAELKAQKRIVELLEKNSAQQKSLDEQSSELRQIRLNSTELKMKLQDLEAAQRTSDIRTAEERQRADRLQDELEEAKLDTNRFKDKVDIAERERDMHMEAGRRHEEALRRKQTEVEEHLSRIERYSQDVSSLRIALREKTELLRQHEGHVSKSDRGILGSDGASPQPEQPSARITNREDHEQHSTHAPPSAKELPPAAVEEITDGRASTPADAGDSENKKLEV